jgi:hypothetical protein
VEAGRRREIELFWPEILNTRHNLPGAAASLDSGAAAKGMAPRRLRMDAHVTGSGTDGILTEGNEENEEDGGDLAKE